MSRYGQTNSHTAREFFPACLVAACLCLSGCANLEKQAAKEAAEATATAAKALAEKAEPVLTDKMASLEAAWTRQRLMWTLEGGQYSVFKAFESAHPKARWRIFTTSDVKLFVRSFEAGFREPERHLRDPGIDPALLARWMATPVKDRVFIAGSQQDTPLVQALRTQLEKEGKAVFFYRFCGVAPELLCTSGTVGAFFGTAGVASVAITPESAESRYIPNEIAAALKLRGSGKGLLLVTPREVIDAAISRAQVQVVTAIIDN